MVRFPGVRPDGRTGLREVVFSKVRPADRYLGGICSLRGGFRRTTDRGGDLRTLRRSDRPQGGADRHLVADRPVDLPGRIVPTYEQIGIWGAVLMVVLRFIQG